MSYHPRARIFGKTTNTAFTAGGPTLDFGPGWSARYWLSNAYRIDAPHDYLAHDEFPVDEPVWPRPDVVAHGKDTVVDAALRWITTPDAVEAPVGGGALDGAPHLGATALPDARPKHASARHRKRAPETVCGRRSLQTTSSGAG